MEYYKKAIRNFAVFKGRAHRSEYWTFVVVNFIIIIVLEIIDSILWDARVFSGLYSLFITIPSLSILVRRLHDTERSGWWVLISFVPVIGFIVLLIFTVQDGTIGVNKYGEDPLNRNEIELHSEN